MSDAHYLAFETGGTKLVAGVAGPDAALLETQRIERIPDHTGEESHVIEQAAK